VISIVQTRLDPFTRFASGDVVRPGSDLHCSREITTFGLLDQFSQPQIGSHRAQRRSRRLLLLLTVPGDISCRLDPESLPLWLISTNLKISHSTPPVGASYPTLQVDEPSPRFD
jgi:hypothetical protein